MVTITGEVCTQRFQPRIALVIGRQARLEGERARVNGDPVCVRSERLT